MLATTHISFNSSPIPLLFIHSFLPLALGFFHPPSSSLLAASLFILTLGFNYSFVIIVFIIVWIVIVLCFCCQEQVVDGTCKGSVCASVSDTIRTYTWHSFHQGKDAPPGGTILMK